MHYMVGRSSPTQAQTCAILAIEDACFGESALSPNRAMALFTRPEHRLYLAQGSSGQAIGFCSCFLLGANSGQRLEIDLLAVLPEWRGRGVGASLVNAAVQGARNEGIARLRAAVRAGNTASERAFERAGLAPSVERYQLLVYAPQGSHPVPYLPAGWRDGHISRATSEADLWSADPAPEAGATYPYELVDQNGYVRARARVASVHTLSGPSLWIEELGAETAPLGALVARGLVERVKRWGLAQAGMLIREEAQNAKLETALVAEGFERYGCFRLFQAP